MCMNNENKFCANCKFYTPYYTLANNKIYRVNDGCCGVFSKNRKNHELMDSCENFEAIVVGEKKCLDDISRKIYELNINLEELSNLLTLYRNNKST